MLRSLTHFEIKKKKRFLLSLPEPLGCRYSLSNFIYIRRCQTHIVIIFLSLLIVLYQLLRVYHHFPFSHDSKNQSNQRIVILAGPHKTGTTSLQNNIMQWTSKNQKPNTLSSRWVWPVPSLITQYESEDLNNWKWNEAKGFYALMEALRDDLKYKVTNRTIFQEMNKKEVIYTYANEFLHAWRTGKNIVLGSEALDFVVKDRDGSLILEELLQIMPWNFNRQHYALKNLRIMNGTDSDVTMVVTYRTPRVDHLVSIWREWNQRRHKNNRLTFYEWILWTGNTLGAIDSLKMVELFRKRGLYVILLDGEGMKSKGLDSSGVVSCDILGAKCNEDKVVIGLEGQKITKNVKIGKGYVNLTKVQKDKIDDVMKFYDCKYYYLLGDKMVNFLYPSAIYDNLGKCADYYGVNKKTMINRVQMKEYILKIVYNESFML